MLFDTNPKTEARHTSYRPARLFGLIEGSLESAGTEHRCKVTLPDNEPLFVGHFPGRPVFPGMIMIEGLVALVERATGTKRALSHIVEAKFKSEAHPGDVLDYVMTQSGETYRAVISIAGREVLKAELRLVAP